MQRARLTCPGCKSKSPWFVPSTKAEVSENWKPLHVDHIKGGEKFSIFVEKIISPQSEYVCEEFGGELQEINDEKQISEVWVVNKQYAVAMMNDLKKNGFLFSSNVVYFNGRKVSLLLFKFNEKLKRYEAKIGERLAIIKLED